MSSRLHFLFFFLVLAFFVGFSSFCGKKKHNILIDGSSTVYPITQAVAEEFMRLNKDYNVSVGISGTGGGFKKFCAGETDISNASREIKKEEIEKCRNNGIEFIELPVAFDALSVIVSHNNNFVDYITVEELRKIYNKDQPAKKWNEVRPNWPDKEIRVYSPGQDSGTYDYFVEVILGKNERIRADARFSEDDNVMVKGVSEDPYAIAFFGFAYYDENKAFVRAIPVKNPKTKQNISPSFDTVMNRTYVPLSRPLFIYVNKASLSKPGIKDFVNFYIENSYELVRQVKYIPFPKEDYQILKAYFDIGKTGSPKNEKQAGEFFNVKELYSAN
ncbi:MAG: PstS family phosphate ABC transporter substrate-binding protein [Leptospiraceae bacterium]|nr:PstS family phosphate ABC transporter substrate-binding protein [Leptospiraceae bacterium]MDW7975121.1 PstS family phosphate ABC transporter substrate-binding protein [Leptospiraceae bacterium]